MIRNLLPRLGLVGIQLFGIGAALPSAASEPLAAPLLQLNACFLAAVQGETPPPALTARNLAIFHLAMAQAGREAGARGWPRASAMAAAGGEVGVAIFPSRKANFVHAAEPFIGSRNAAASSARDLGQAVARAWLEARAADGSSTTIHYLPAEGPGQWRRTPPGRRPPELPHWGGVKPFLLQAAAQFRPPPPPQPDSSAFGRDLDEVRRLGAADSAERTPDQTQAAHFWSDFSYTPGPPGHWNEIACALIANRGIEIQSAADLLARLNAVMADAGVACWEAKYYYNYWRPITALPAAEGAGASRPEWVSLLPAPPHPEYPSGHATFSGAAAITLRDFFGTDRIALQVTSTSTPGVTRSFPSFSACAEEIALSRIWGGIHFPSAGREGCLLGAKIARCAIGRPLPQVQASPSLKNLSLKKFRKVLSSDESSVFSHSQGSLTPTAYASP